MKKIFTPRVTMLTTALLLVIFLDACKKDKDEPVPEGMASIQVVLPAGASIDLSKTSVYSLSQSFGVGSDGKATIAFNGGSYEVVFLYDEANKPIMAGIISNENKEISITTTAQALLYYGLGIMYSHSNEERIAYIKKIPTYPQFAAFKAQLEQLFIANPNMLSTDAYNDAYVKAVGEIHNKPVLDLIGRQIKVQDADTIKSGVSVRAKSGSDEEIEALNKYVRRGHAYLYKVAYRDNTNFPHTLLSEILSITPAEYNFAVKGAVGVAPEVSGPQALPLESYETESTWKVRVVGVGKNDAGIGMSDVERTKYEEMCIDFFAADLLMPLLLTELHQSNQMYKVLPNNIETVRAYINEVKALVQPATIDMVKNGEYLEAVTDFSAYALWDSYKLNLLKQSLISGVSAVVDNQQELQSSANIEENAPKQIEYNKIIEDGLFSYLLGINTDNEDENKNPIDARFLAISGSNAIEQWTVLSKDNDVTITPKHSKALKLTNHTLTASATAALNPGERIEYVWNTAGAFGVFKQNGAEVTTTTSSITTYITYYGKVTPNDDNIETVYVTASITGPNGTRKLGTDTAYVNVKSLSIVMKPNGATLSPKRGNNALTLRLLNADGTNPIINGNSVQYKVDWSTAGSYGHFSGNTTHLTTADNSIVYTATDEDVLSATETITARVFFRLSSSPDWIFREEVKGTVKIVNDPKKIVYYAPLVSFHNDRNDGGGNLWHYTNCGVAINPVADAISYSVKITLPGVNPSTYSETWSATNPGWLYGYMYAINPATIGTYYVGYGASWGGCPDGDCDHSIPNCSGGEAVITITLQ